jgi:CCR4-NOT transcription complex subunit 3
MELFKALEKETKTKAFSKEGLILATRLDPAEKAKLDARAQLEEFVDALNRQIEQYEAEIETLQATAGGRGKKKGKDANGAGGRAEELERSNERRKWHIGNLEASMRALENGRVTADQVAEIKEDVAYFVESNEEEDFEEDEGIYDELHLEEEDDNIGILASHDGISNVGGNDDFSESDMQSVVDDNPPKPTPVKTRSMSEDPMPAPTSPLLVRKPPATRKTTDKEKPKEETTTPSKPTRTVSEKTVPASTVVSPAAPRQSTAPALPPIKYAAAAAAAVQASAPVVAPVQTREAVMSPPVEQQVASPIAMPPTPELAAPPAPPGLSQAPTQAPTQQPPIAQLAPPPSAPASPHQVKPSPAPSVATLNVGMSSVSLAASPVHSPSNGYTVPSAVSPQPAVQPQTQPPNLPQQAIPAVQSVSSQIQQSRQQQQSQVQNGAQEAISLPAAQQQQQQPTPMAHTPSALSDLMTRFDEVRKNCTFGRCRLFLRLPFSQRRHVWPMWMD